MKFKQLFIIVAIILTCSLNSFSQLIISSGIKGGSYNLLADDFKLITDIEIELVESGGSVDNYDRLLKENDMNITFLQSDVLFYNNFEESENTRYIKVLLPLSYEEIHLITLQDNNEINSLNDLSGKRVAIGKSTQGTNITAKLIKRLTGIEWIDVEEGFNVAFSLLISGSVDAFFFVGAAPVGKLNEFSQRTESLLKLIPIEHRKLRKIYIKTVIPAGTYDWVPNDLTTFSVASVLVKNVKNETEKSRELTEKFLTDIRDNIEILRTKGHPKWQEIRFDFNNTNWPIHKTAKRVFSY